MPILSKCDECGIQVKFPPSQFNRSKNHFCSRQCHMAFMNRELNPIRMTPEVREKLRKVRIGSGEGKTYTKTYGVHTHRVVAEQILGRPLKKGEVVHHIDGDKRNNDPSNLMVFENQSEHATWHAKHKGGDGNHVQRKIHLLPHQEEVLKKTRSFDHVAYYLDMG